MMDIQKEILSNSGFTNLELLAKQVVEGFIIGLHKSPFHGFSVEFAENNDFSLAEFEAGNYDDALVEDLESKLIERSLDSFQIIN